MPSKGVQSTSFRTISGAIDLALSCSSLAPCSHQESPVTTLESRYLSNSFLHEQQTTYLKASEGATLFEF
eukprot:scaffold4236_cov133-Skeletonema_menzelii.AAC.2